MNERIKEALRLLQEECAEVIVEVSKCERFGIDSVHYKTNLKHSTMLEDEIADVLTLVDVLLEEGLITQERLDAGKVRKRVKLEKWSTLYVQKRT